MNMEEIAAHLQLISPPSGEDVVDSSESLYDSFRARRVAQEGADMRALLSITSKTHTTGLSLFSPVEVKEEPGARWQGVVTGMFF
jgi:hypothetical protein